MGKKNKREIDEPMAEQLMEFEEWYSLREGLIPAHHHREIIKADFKARKVPNMATLKEFDEALRRYGISLNL